MSSIKLKLPGSEYMVTYEYQPAQKGDAETEDILECFEITEIREVLNDGELSESLLFDFDTSSLIEVQNKIANEFKHSY